MENQIGIREIGAGIIAIVLIATAILFDAKEEPTEMRLGAETEAVAVAIDDVALAQEAYFQKTGSYLQVKSDGTTVDGKIAKDELKIDVVDFEIHTYVLPSGEKGYFIITPTKDGKAVIDKGNGGFSYTPNPPIIIPNTTSTAETIQ